ncbi:alpha/beta fold hydrolase [Haloglomus litoreum]|uniref:alpha/beta fold hydrolase n=1 Tax=Haloglomus litoreum TaxID=3034026 RepID=UPI0023E7B5FA|nr:alpha/beta hydrolase [Haloglomus sp. DT116]
MPSVQTNDIETHYERTGDGPPVVMAHGAGYDHRWWEPQVEALAEQYEVITYDLRGHGRTGGGGDWHQYEMGLYALDLYRLVERLELDEPLVVGHSLGGMFLPEFAARYPDSVRGLVLADAQVTPGEGVGNWFFGNVVHPAVIMVNRVFGLDRAEALQEAIGRLLADDDDEERPADEDAELAAYQESVSERHEREEVTRVQRGLRRFAGGPVDEVTVPTLGVYGSLERKMMARNAEALSLQHGTATIEEIADAGHLLTWTHAKAFNEELVAFADRVFDGADQ